MIKASYLNSFHKPTNKFVDTHKIQILFVLHSCIRGNPSFFIRAPFVHSWQTSFLHSSSIRAFVAILLSSFVFHSCIRGKPPFFIRPQFVLHSCSIRAFVANLLSLFRPTFVATNINLDFLKPILIWKKSLLQVHRIHQRLFYYMHWI